MSIPNVIARVRDSVVALFRYREVRDDASAAKREKGPQVRVGWGSGFCVVANRYIVTASHVLCDGDTRNPDDRFVAFSVPDNGDAAFHFPVVGFPLERPDLDLAILELGAGAVPAVHLPALPVSFAPPPDGARVVTLGFPAPEIVSLSIDPQGRYSGGNFFLKSHANEGIVAASYRLGAAHVFEFNVGWHHGESGGPVVCTDDPVAAFTLMQHYRTITSPHGAVAGPRRGCSLSAIEDELRSLGASIL